MNIPLRTITQRNDKLQAHDQNTGISQHNEDVLAHIVTKWIELLISERASDEVESKIEIRLYKELVNFHNKQKSTTARYSPDQSK